MDDIKDPKKFNLDIYKKDFIDNSECKNQVSSVLSAMVSQLAFGGQTEL